MLATHDFPDQDALVRILKMVLQSKVVPPDILQTLLNLAEFMEHEVEVSSTVA